MSVAVQSAPLFGFTPATGKRKQRPDEEGEDAAGDAGAARWSVRGISPFTMGIKRLAPAED